MLSVLINPTSPAPPPTYFGPPYGLAMVAACLERASLPVLCCDFDRVPAAELPAEVEKVIKKDAPRYLGISVNSSTRGVVYDLLKSVKRKHPKLTIILGGAFASLEPELLLKNFPVDYVVIGEGEETLPELIRCLNKGRSPAKIRGLAFKKGGKPTRTAPRGSVTDLDALPSPAFHLFDFKPQLKRYQGAKETEFAASSFIRNNRCTTVRSAMTLLSSRGCPFGCVFCPMSTVRKNKLRAHSAKRFVDIVEHFYKSAGLREFVFGDNFFTFDRRRALAICEEIQARGLKITWICMTRADSVDAQLLRKMGETGCVEISYGIESGDPSVQRVIGKNLKLDKVSGTLQATREAGIASVLMLMVGNPGESHSTISKTLSFIRNLTPDRILIKTTRVYPGTHLHDIAAKKGIIPPKYYLGREHVPPPFTVEHTKKELKQLKSMLQPRQMFVDLAPGCNNGCSGCGVPAGAGKRAPSTPSAKQTLLLAARRAEQVILGGGESLLRKDLPKLVACAKKLTIPRLQLYTNARLLAYPKKAEVLRRGGVEDILLPIYSHRPALHDQKSRIPGSLAQTFRGVANWKQAGGRVRVRVCLDRDNYKELPDLARLLIEMDVDETVFAFLRSPEGWSGAPIEECPRMSDAVGRVGDAIARIRELGHEAHLSGIPACVAGGKTERLYETHRPFDEMLEVDLRYSALSAVRAKSKLKVEACRECRQEPICEGLWKDYARRYGSSELRAL